MGKIIPVATHIGCCTLGIEKVFTYRPGDNGAPVLLQKNFSGNWRKSIDISLFIVVVVVAGICCQSARCLPAAVDNEQTVYHISWV